MGKRMMVENTSVSTSIMKAGFNSAHMKPSTDRL